MLYKDYCKRRMTIEFINRKVYYYWKSPVRFRLEYNPMQSGYDNKEYHAYYIRLWFTIFIRNPFKSQSSYEIGFKLVDRLRWRKTPVWRIVRSLSLGGYHTTHR